MKPPTGGPSIGPSSAGTVRTESALTRSRRSTVRRSRRRPTGTIIAPPVPWRTRAATKPASELEKPHRIDPAVKTTMAARNTVRVPKRSAIQPLAGMNTASARR